MKIDIFVIDFDSTFVNGESLNLMVDMALREHQRRSEVGSKLRILSDLCMKSEVGFKEYFKMKIEIIKQSLREEHLLRVSKILEDKVSPHIIKLLERIRSLDRKIIVISNSFKLILKDIMEKHGVDIYFANKHIADKNGYIIGFDESNPLANDGGKENIIKFLKNKDFIRSDEKIIMIGDGMPDLKVYREKVSDYFLNFALNKNRKLKKHRINDDPNFIICRKPEEMDAFIDSLE
ncbi:MAG: HAD-IB family phosphatase [Rickettsiales bacterium]|jgi:D-3-phosphoglycerate dehydrogenase|nr:HAD-IB family phosphatase [Rickettsiales bacterium]